MCGVCEGARGRGSGCFPDLPVGSCALGTGAEFHPARKTHSRSQDVLTCRRRLSSWCRMGMFSYSAALEMISMSPRTLVLAFRDMLKSSERGKEGHWRGQSRQRRSRELTAGLAQLHPATRPSRPWKPRRVVPVAAGPAGPHRWWCS